MSASPGLGSLDSRTSESDMPASLLSPQSLQLSGPVSLQSPLPVLLCVSHSHIPQQAGRQAARREMRRQHQVQTHERSFILLSQSAQCPSLPPSLPCTLHGLHSTPPPSLPTAHSFFTHTHSLILTHSQETSSWWSYLVHTYYAKVISSKKQNCNDNTALTADAHFVFYFPQVILRLT